MAPSFVQEDGNSILHCEGKSTIGSGNNFPFNPFLKNVLRFAESWGQSFENCSFFNRLSIRRLHQFCA